MSATFLRAVVFAASARQIAASCAYGTHLAPRAETVTVNTFGYSGAIGPTAWHTLDSEANAQCAIGTTQSPIDLLDGQYTQVSGSEFQLNLPDFEDGAEFENLGTTVEIVGEGGNMTIPTSSTTFDFRQFHFHLPAEHLDNGTSLAMEMHMVFSNTNTSEVAVLGVFLDVVAGSSNTAATPFLETVFSSVAAISTPGTATTTAAFEMSELVSMLSATTFKSYSGSLTTPPCSEGVHWFVASDTLSVTLDTWKSARDVIGFNSRFVQNVLGEDNVLATACPSGSA